MSPVELPRVSDAERHRRLVALLGAGAQLVEVEAAEFAQLSGGVF